jgi:hypothetical protein
MTTVTPAKLIFVGIIVAGLVGFVLAIRAWQKAGQSLGLPRWRKFLFGLGFLAVAGQVVLFALVWTNIWADRAMFAAWARLVDPLFLTAVALILAGKGPARWWLLMTSFLLFVLCFFIMLSP